MHHSSRHDPWATRLFAKIERDSATGCWNWTASTRQGYGQIWTPSRPGPRRILGAHRAMYELANGPIPSALVLDHLCRNTLCVNPAHLETVTQRENVLRGDGVTAQNARRSTCRLGHELQPKTSGQRYCPTCQQTRWLAHRDARLAQLRADRAARRASLVDVPRPAARRWAIATGVLPPEATGGPLPYVALAAYAEHLSSLTA